MILNELGLRQGKTRVDVAVINGEISGYEIKSSADTLERFAHQQALYSEVLDRAWIVSTHKHLKHIESILPDWWGIVLVRESGNKSPQLETIRKAEKNPNQVAVAVVELLWRQEALDLLVSKGEDKGVKSKPRRILWDRIVDLWETEALYKEVREALKARTRWRQPDRQRLRYDVKFPDGARFLESLDFASQQHTRSCNDPLD